MVGAPVTPLVSIGRVRPALDPAPAPVSGPVVEPSPWPVGTTASGLPQRRPSARMVTVEPTGDPIREPAATGAGFRDAESIRSNLSRHYDGVRAAREHTNTESEAREGQ